MLAISVFYLADIGYSAVILLCLNVPILATRSLIADSSQYLFANFMAPITKHLIMPLSLHYEPFKNRINDTFCCFRKLDSAITSRKRLT